MQFIDRKFTSVLKRWHLGWLTGSAFLLFSAGSLPADANVTIIREDFSDSTAYGWTVGGVGPLCLTAEGPSPPESIPNCSTTSDPPREGTLRLTNLRISDQRAFVFYVAMKLSTPFISSRMAALQRTTSNSAISSQMGQRLFPAASRQRLGQYQ
jgi:hypothetical protein